MPRYVLLLRGVNVGGRNRLPMRDLVAILEELGCSSVATYIQSGNAVFEASAATARALPAAVSASIESRLGFRPPALLRTREELDAVRAGSPFPVDRTEWLHVGFLASRPAPEAVAALEPTRFAPDEFAVVGSEVYLYYPNGLGRSKMTNDYFDRALKTVSTVRNWRTVETLASMARGASD
ncbi:MAG: DUF1697 domain-containing protein [Dehalococcoidia bacterium]|nr:DUF1697 domain-containing protein [Dehalococcoidia bacterium]